jgi:hypothetical protein
VASPPDDQRPCLAEVPVLLARLGVYLDEVGISPRAMNAIARVLGTFRVHNGVNGADKYANPGDNRACVSDVYAK